MATPSRVCVDVLVFLKFGWWLYLSSDPECRLLASSSKDGTIRIWDTVLSKVSFILTGHTHCVTCVLWGGEGLLYSSSQDRTIKVWRAADVSPRALVMGGVICMLTSQGVLCRTLQGHGHWVNTMALSTGYALRTGAYDLSDTSLGYMGVQGLSREWVCASEKGRGRVAQQPNLTPITNVYTEDCKLVIR